MTAATKEKTWAEKTLEAIPEILKTTPMTMLIDCGLEGGSSGIEYSSLPDLVLDEEFGEKEKEYELQQGNVKELVKGLPEVIRDGTTRRGAEDGRHSDSLLCEASLRAGRLARSWRDKNPWPGV